MASPYKLHINRWAGQVQLNRLTTMMSQRIAAGADMVFELLTAYRDGSFDALLPGRPPRDQWLGMYRSHRQLTAAVGDHFPELMGPGRKLQRRLDWTRTYSLWASNDPDGLRDYLNGVGRFKLLRMLQSGLRIMDRAYRHHLRDLQAEFTAPALDDGRAEAMVNESHEIHFYMRIVLPCLAMYRCFPALLYRRACQSGLRQQEAIEKLVRLDRTAIHLDAVERWCNEPGGQVSMMRMQMLQQWMTQGLNEKQFSPVQVKKMLGGLILTLAELFGGYIDWKNPGKQPAQVTAEDVRNLFHAVAQDRAKCQGQPWLDVRDDDIEPLLPGSWLRGMRPYKRQWRAMFLQGGSL